MHVCYSSYSPDVLNASCYKSQWNGASSVKPQTLVWFTWIGYAGINIKCESILAISRIPAWGVGIISPALLSACLSSRILCALSNVTQTQRGRVNAHWKDTERRKDRDTDVSLVKILRDEQSRSTDREMCNGRQTTRLSLNHVCHSHTSRKREICCPGGELWLLLFDVFETL